MTELPATISAEVDPEIPQNKQFMPYASRIALDATEWFPLLLSITEEKNLSSPDFATLFSSLSSRKIISSNSSSYSNTSSNRSSNIQQQYNKDNYQKCNKITKSCLPYSYNRNIGKVQYRSFKIIECVWGNKNIWSTTTKIYQTDHGQQETEYSKYVKPLCLKGREN